MTETEPTGVKKSWFAAAGETVKRVFATGAMEVGFGLLNFATFAATHDPFFAVMGMGWSGLGGLKAYRYFKGKGAAPKGPEPS